MYDIASSVLQQKLAQVRGVGQVVIGGGALPAVRPTIPLRLGPTPSPPWPAPTATSHPSAASIGIAR